MRKIFLITVCCCLLATSLTGQITRQHNGLRPGDRLEKIQVEYIEPGVAGNGMIWDLRNRPLQGREYVVEFSLPKLYNDSVFVMGEDTFSRETVAPDELIIALEHHTAYYYRQTDSCLTMLGFVNAVNNTRYTGALHHLCFPLDTFRSECRSFHLVNLYSMSKESQAQGTMELSVDGYGMMILPSEDTLRGVTRVRTVQTTIPREQDMNIAAPLILESYRWYAPGYRYPILESVSTKGIEPGATRSFATSFYFPPERHFYVDQENERVATRSVGGGSSNGRLIPWESGFRCYPNPVVRELVVEYVLNEAAEVQIRLFDAGGRVLLARPLGSRQAGVHTEPLDLTHLTPGSYVVELLRGATRESRTIIKE